MKVIVFGGLGFIGRHAGRLLQQHCDVVLADRDDADALAHAGCDVAVFAQGARVSDQVEALQVHAELTSRWLAACRPRRVVYLSSGECYGDAPVPFVEDGPLLGTSPYARAKLEGERRVRAWASGAGYRHATVLRLAVVYGADQAGNMLLPYVATELAAGRVVEMTEGRQTRDFVAVEDVARALLLASLPHADGVPARLDTDHAAGTNEAAGTTLNIGTGIEVSVREAASELARQMSRLTGRDHTSQLAFGARPARSHDATRYALDPRRAERELGWSPRIGLSEGLRRLAEAHVRA